MCILFIYNTNGSRLSFKVAESPSVDFSGRGFGEEFAAKGIFIYFPVCASKNT